MREKISRSFGEFPTMPGNLAGITANSLLLMTKGAFGPNLEMPQITEVIAESVHTHQDGHL